MTKLTNQRIDKLLAALNRKGVKGDLYSKIATVLRRHDEMVDKYHELEAGNLLLKTEANTFAKTFNAFTAEELGMNVRTTK